MGDWFKSLGCYPPNYNQKVHGPYMPHRYYGPKDTPLGDVKLADLKDWFSRRDLSPRGFTHAVSRMRNLWFFKWERPLKSTAAITVQYCIITSMMFYFASFAYQRSLKHRKYH